MSFGSISPVGPTHWIPVLTNAARPAAACRDRPWHRSRWSHISVTEHLSECKRNTEPWKMEHRMLRHKALMQCARYAFGFSGVTDEDEAADTPGMRDVTPAKGKASGVVIDPFKQADDTPKPLEESAKARKETAAAAEPTYQDLKDAPEISWDADSKTEPQDLL